MSALPIYLMLYVIGGLSTVSMSDELQKQCPKLDLSFKEGAATMLFWPVILPFGLWAAYSIRRSC